MSLFRLNKPSEGAKTQAWTNTAELGVTSYIWQPWFGTWQADAAFTRTDTSAEQDSTADLVTGNVEVNLFHRSHFPFSAFVSLQDSRVEITDLSQADNDVRTLRIGLTQQYQDIDNAIFYYGAFNHDEQEEVSNGNTSESDRLLFTADRNGEIHDLSGVLSLNRAKSTIADSEVITGQGSFSHTYRPSREFSATTNTVFSSVDAQTNTQDGNNSVYALASQAEWRPGEGTFRMQGDVLVGREESDTKTETEFGTLVRTSEFVDRFRANVSGRYELTDEATLFAEVGVDRRDTEAQSRTTTFQTISATYVSQPIDWRRFEYTYTGGAGLGNNTDSEADGVHSESVNLGHAITRGWTGDLFGPTAFVFSAGQDGQFLNQSDEGARAQISHRASISASKATPTGTTYGQLTAFDVRDYGETEGSLTSLSASATHNRVLSRYRNFDMIASYNFNSSSNEGFSQDRDVTSLELRYRDGRLFGLSRLSFESRLRGGFINLIASGEEDSGPEIEWDNHLDYRIGLLEVNSRVAFTQRDDNSNFLFTLGLTRRF